MKHWQFYLAVILFIILLFTNKIHEGMDISPEYNAVIQSFTPEQTTIKQQIEQNIDAGQNSVDYNETMNKTIPLIQQLAFSLTPEQMNLLPIDKKQMVEKGKTIILMTSDQIKSMTPEEVNLDMNLFRVLILRLKQLGITLTSQQTSRLNEMQLSMINSALTTSPQSQPMINPPMINQPMPMSMPQIPMTNQPMINQPMSMPQIPMSNQPMINQQMSSQQMSSQQMMGQQMTNDQMINPQMYKHYMDLQEQIILIKDNYSGIRDKIYGLESEYTKLQGEINGIHEKQREKL